MSRGVWCHEEVSRGGEAQPCDKPAVAMRDHPEQGRYPVCVAHCRVGSMVTLAALLAETRITGSAEGWDAGLTAGVQFAADSRAGRFLEDPPRRPPNPYRAAQVDNRWLNEVADRLLTRGKS